MFKLIQQIKHTLTFVAGGVTSHFISKALEYKNNQILEQAQIARYQKLELLTENVNQVNVNVSNLQNTCESLLKAFTANPVIYKAPDHIIQNMSNKATNTKDLGTNLLNLIDNNSLSDPNIQQQLSDGFNTIQANSTELQQFLEQVHRVIFSSNVEDKKFLPSGGDFNFEYFTAYLDSLSLLQESALLHILLFIIILLTLINIFAALFGNEIINYFDLENKFPSISGFLRLRTKLQNYYLTWNILFLLFLILGAIILNIFIIIVC